jgi:DNA-binding response OmpR family regulator
MKRETKQHKVTTAIDALEIGEFIHKKQLINSIWGYCDYFTSRSFDVFLTKAKKSLFNKRFKTIKGKITRISI